MEVSGQLQAVTALSSMQKAQYPLNRWLGWPHSQSIHCGEEENEKFHALLLSNPTLDYTAQHLT